MYKLRSESLIMDEDNMVVEEVNKKLVKEYKVQGFFVVIFGFGKENFPEKVLIKGCKGVPPTS